MDMCSCSLSHLVVSCHILSRTSCYIFSYILFHLVTSCFILLRLVTSCYILSHLLLRLVTSCYSCYFLSRVLSHIVTSCYALLRLVTSCYILLHLFHLVSCCHAFSDTLPHPGAQAVAYAACMPLYMHLHTAPLFLYHCTLYPCYCLFLVLTFTF